MLQNGFWCWKAKCCIDYLIIACKEKAQWGQRFTTLLNVKSKSCAKVKNCNKKIINACLYLPWTWAEYSAAFCRLTRGRFLVTAAVADVVVAVNGDITEVVYDAVGTVDVVEDDAVVFSNWIRFSNICCTCKMSTYSSKLFCADNVGRLSRKLIRHNK